MFFVRTATDRDLDQIQALLATTWHATYDAFYGFDKVAELTARWHSKTALAARLARRDAEFVVADNGSAIAGMGFAAMSTTDKDIAVLHQLYVLPKFQRQGIGRDIFAELETCFPDAKRMQIEVEPANAAAVAFYEEHGFVKVGNIANCGDDQSGIPAIIMEKPLG